MMNSVKRQWNGARDGLPLSVDGVDEFQRNLSNRTIKMGTQNPDGRELIPTALFAT
jgi:hypothetical protein